MMRHCLLSILLLSTVLPSAVFADEGRLQPRAEVGTKLGSKRSLGTGAIWAPISQGCGHVFYGDMRFMADDHDNQEGNLGFGYREIAGDVILGAHGWVDRRRTESGNMFHQSVVGFEILGRDWDVRANGYAPLSGAKTRTVITPNNRSSDPYLAGSGIYYDIGGQNVATLTEEPQPGFDLELGVRVPVFERDIDAVRVYGGGYHFAGDKAEDMNGARARIVADVTPSFSVGGRFQRDDVRGSQGFLEATLRFPFTAKKSFREDGLRARLDESPERDVDIVTGAKAAYSETPPRTPVAVHATATGDAQRVLHVDNAAVPGGDGSKEKPFNTLKAAEAQMQAYDVIYVHAGDGTDTGQDQGIIINKPGVALIGAGTNFVYDTGRFTSAADTKLSGTLIAAKTAAPVITSTIVDPVLGRTTGVWVAESDAQVAGLKVESAFYGVNVSAPGAAIANVSLSDLTLAGNDAGIYIRADGGDAVDNVSVARVVAEGSADYAVAVLNWGRIGTVALSDITANNGDYGVYYLNLDTAAAVTMTNMAMADNQTGIYFNNGGTLGDVSVSGATLHNSVSRSIQIAGWGTMGDLRLSGVTMSGTSTYGVEVSNGGTMGDIALSAISGDDIGTATIFLDNQGTMGNTVLQDVRAHNNTTGIQIWNQDNMGDIALSRVSAGDNTLTGIEFQNQGTAGSFSMASSSITGNGFTGLTLDNGIMLADPLDLSGGNSIHGNTTYDIRLFGPYDVNARNVWWGQAGGPLPGKVDAGGAGIIDTANPLGSEPGLP